MKKVVSVFFCIVVLFGLFAFSAGASAPILCPRCGSSAKLVGSREEGMYIVYKYRCTNSACGHTFESKFLAGGGSTRGGGAGRRDPLPGYSSDGVANYNKDGFLIWQPSWPSDYTKYTYLSTPTYYSITSSSFTKEVALVTHSASGNHLSVLLTPLSGQSSFPFSDIVFKGMSFTAPVSGYYTSQSVRVNAVGRSSEPRSYSKSNNWRYKAVYFNAGDSVYCGDSSTTSFFSVGAWNIFERCTYLKADIYTPIFTIEPIDSMVTKQTNITINNNTFSGNIYQDTKNNLTYIYPQYSSVDDSGNTITKIFENPIIYNNTTNQYYTYDNTTNNYYYITYVTATPEPTASPEPSPSSEPVDPILPDTQNYIISKMNSNTFTDEHGTWVASGSSKYSDVFNFFHAFDRSTSDFWETNVSPSYLQIEIPDPENYYIDGYIMRISKFNNRYSKDWTLQGSDDGETWDDLDNQKGQNLSDMEEHKYTLTLRKAYKYYRLNMSNYASSMCSLSHFNLLGYDAKDVVIPTPSPSPTPDPGTTPTPTPGGDSSGLLDFLREFRDNVVQGFADLTANIKLSIENLTINIQNIFNKKFLDISTGETAATPTPSPTPSATPEPTATPEPSATPVITPTPSPEPTDKPSKTTNFWTFIFGGGSDDGTDKGHKGILWALISLILAIISLLTGLGASAKHLFPFLPSSVITTIHICVIVLFLFAVIKFIRSFL